MRIFKDNAEYHGTPEEISMFFALSAPTITQDDVPFPASDLVPLEDTVAESTRLRKELEKNPAYSPFGGVVAPRESEEAVSSVPSAEIDTGVVLSD